MDTDKFLLMLLLRLLNIL